MEEYGRITNEKKFQIWKIIPSNISLTDVASDSLQQVKGVKNESKARHDEDDVSDNTW